MTDEVCKLCGENVEAHRLGHYCGMFVTDEDPRTKALRTRIAELEGALKACAEAPHSGWTIAQALARATLNGEKKDG
jgi:hypothetical protein